MTRQAELPEAERQVLAEAAAYISFDLDPSWPSPEAERIREALAQVKSSRVEAGDQAGAKQVWCLEQAIEARSRYAEAFHLLKAEDYYEGWCALERAEISLSFLERHVPVADTPTLPGLISKLIGQYQQIFPYAVFFSPEFIVERAECTICGAARGLRTGCGHRVGEIYDGEMASRRITSARFVGVGIVTSPLQRYSVAFVKDEDGSRHDQYDYSVVAYLVGALHSPFDDWDVELTTRRHPHDLFEGFRPDGPCPCESDETYERCCLRQEGVLRPHVEFSFSAPPPQGYATTAYTRGFGSP